MSAPSFEAVLAGVVFVGDGVADGVIVFITGTTGLAVSTSVDLAGLVLISVAGVATGVVMAGGASEGSLPMVSDHGSDSRGGVRLISFSLVF